MSNTSNNKANKGSKFWIQEIVNNDLLRSRLEKMLGENLRWYSPLQAESYKEYQLKEQKIFSEVLGLSQKDFKEKFSFWSTNQPHWDAIALSDEDILYLFEAKAHLKEIYSKITAINVNSIKKITNAMRITFEQISAGTANFSSWLEKYYQLGNRFTFVHRMNQINLPTKLILLNITDDKTYIPTPQEDWQNHYEKIFQEMLGKNSPPPNVRTIYFSGR